METINDRISFLIQNLDVSRTKFAEKLNLSPSFITKICNGEKTPSDRTVADICREFGVSQAWLCDGDGEMFVTRTMNQELAIMVNELMSEADESFRKRFVSALLELPPQFWPELEKFLHGFANDK